MSKHNIQLSKTLSYLLRHGANKSGLNMRADGFILVADLVYFKVNQQLALPQLKRYNVKDVEDVVVANDKQRFTLLNQNDELWIRANQGHTISVAELELLEIQSPEEIPTALHGTFMDKWQLISSTYSFYNCIQRQRGFQE